ncbi:hypothetical protein N8T08_000869 [Aspergillus melleus]|uniref:Uncharacterized protein n=1 Tax=Aspergillus melleus TaxID=138277 RepID=A0ACC3BAD6_9EURO|nr:hypothetical protein N8T08_000869 [Aspergillus melleus]
MDPNNPGYPLHPQPPYPVTSQSPPGQPFPYYSNAMPSFPQQKTPVHLPLQSQQSALGVPLQPGPGGAVMPAGFPQHSSGPHANFSAPPFAQPPVPTSMGQFLPQTTSAASLPSSAAQSYSQNMASVSANNMAIAQQQRPVPQQQQPQQQTPSQPPTQGSQGAAASAQSPTPAASAREKARVAALLDINSMLLQEVVNLQAAGKAGGPPASQPGGPDGNTNNPSPTSEQAADATKGPAQKPSPEYLECMRRLQANLAYLATVADRAKKSGGVAPPNPGIMTPPPHMSSMNDIYNRLSELFPHTAHGTPQQSPQPSQGNGKPSPSPATDSVV